MKITLYKNNSENNAINKNLAYIGDLLGTLRQATSVLNPVILIEMDNGVMDYDIDLQAEGDDISYIDDEEYDVSINLNYSIFECNYCYIEEFNRFYFIDDIVIQNNKLFSLALSVDVLESYKNKFMPLDAFILRNEFTYDSFVKDENIKYFYDKAVEEYVLPKGDKVNTTFRTDMDLIENNILISVINTLIEADFDRSNSPDILLPNVRSTMMASKTSYRIYSMYLAELKNLCLALQQNDIYKDFILSCIIYPFVPEYKNEMPLILGKTACVVTKGFQFERVYVSPLEKEMPEYKIIADFTITSDSFMDYEPFTQYELYIPYLSWIPVSADDILNNRIIVYYVIDYSNGNSQVCVYDITNSKMIYSGSTQIGVKLGLTTTNQKEVNDLHNSNNIALGVSMLTSAISIIGGIATMNPVAVGGGLISGGASIAKYEHNENTNYLHANGSVSSGTTGLYMCQDVKIKKTKLKPKNYDEDYFKLYGRPLCKYEKLENLKGFTTISEIHLEDIGATQPELNDIYNLLKDGVIIK